MSADVLNISPSSTLFKKEMLSNAPSVQVGMGHIIKVIKPDSRQLEKGNDTSISISYLTSEEAAFQISQKFITPIAVIIDLDFERDEVVELHDVLKQHCIPFILFTETFQEEVKEKASTLLVDDYLFGTMDSHTMKQLGLIQKLKIYNNNRENLLKGINSRAIPKIKLWRLKRTFDFVVALGALIILFPLLLLIAIIIKLESEGPVFYNAKRAGSGYKIFNFYKFRSMRVGADLELKKFTELNQYSTDESDSIFFKIKDDPRITRFGMFLRMTSLDELPQLLNVLKGDMSLVGNRPLPLYEAEKLTKDKIAWRFLAPAGLTGLWQITKRGKDDMSPEERIQLDMEYAMNNSFLGDIKIILKTFPALLQKEKV